VIPAAFEYSRPKSVDEALGLLAQHAGSAKLIAGGQSLLPLLKLRVASAERLIDIGRLGELRGIRDWNGGLSIGALTTYREVLDSPLSKRFPILAEAIKDVGDVQVRNRGTIGGSIAHADPASDFPAVAIALDAQIVLRSKGGERVVPAETFLQGAFTTDIHDDEILTEVRIPTTALGTGQAYTKLEQPASGYSIVGVAAVIKDVHGVMGSGKLEFVRVGITGVGDVAYRAKAVEDLLINTMCDQSDIRGAAAHAADGQMVGSDIHADRTYRTAMAAVYTRRALEAALHRTP
jgi:aerobic carbon-monoxide dehydrogenase medium subunit